MTLRGSQPGKVARFADVGNRHCVRVREGGEVLATVALDRGAFACMLEASPLGRQHEQRLLIWTTEKTDEAIADRTGQVLVAETHAPRAGWP